MAEVSSASEIGADMLTGDRSDDRRSFNARRTLDGPVVGINGKEVRRVAEDPLKVNL